jgi:RNA polymerase sigma-70 factor (ECF subfamily)
MQRYAAGDEAAFAELYELVVPRVRRYIICRTSDPQLAEDLLQQTLLRLHRSRSDFLAGEEVLPWLLAIARRIIIDGLRRATCATKATLGLAPVIASTGERPDEIVEALELASQLDSEVAELPEKQRAAFDLLRHRELSPSEAATALQITVGALRVRLHRAQAALKTAMAR